MKFIARITLSSLILTLSIPASLRAAPHPVIEMQSNDVVAFVGDTLMEREQTYGFLEQRLTVRFPERNVIFRDLGWSADKPDGESRASFGFDQPGKGFEQLTNQIGLVQPTVVFIGYGMASSFAGEAGIPKFKADLNKLIDAINAVCTNKVRFIFLSPIHHEHLAAPLPDPTEHNKQLALYTRAVEDIATERKSPYFSLFDNLLGAGLESHPPRQLTDNGIHLNAYGYLRLAEAVEKGFVWEPNLWRVRITTDGQITPGSVGTKISALQREGNHLQFTALDDQLISPFLRDTNGVRIPSGDSPSLVQIDGLQSGKYDLKEDDVIVASGTAKEWGRGIAIERGAQFEQAQKLNEAIRRKNSLYFDRWRPENQTYLFGFRNYEQGQNAKEIPMFDKLIAEQETIIAKLRRPVSHSFELVSANKSEEAKAFAAKPEPAPEPLPPVPQLPTPEFTVAPGFEISLYAESPLLAKPIQMNFDPQGRLWVVSSSVYPQIVPGQEAEDKVLILEDTKGTGHADKSTVFADGLLIPTGVQPGDGGVYVGQGTQLLFFKDNKGTGHADERRIVLSGFGTEDTHHIVHTLKWGPDGMLYFDQSIYIHTHIETPNGVETLNSGGIWHLRPGSMDLGVYLRGFCNPWGHQFDTYGQSFVTDGAGNNGINWSIPGATYFTYAIMRREMKSVSPGSYPKFCSLELINSRQFPDDWQGNAITCDFRAHRVVRFAIDEKGGGYETRELPDLVTTTNVTFRPIDVKLGPDGALYIADWANPIIQHGEVDFRDPRRDHEHGRIWRITAKGRPLMKRFDFIHASNRELFGQLVSPEKYNVEQARRVLTERGKAIQPDLAKWVKSQTNELALLNALWMYQSIDVAEPGLLKKIMTASDCHVRAAATRVAGYWQARLPDATVLISSRVNDSNPRVQIEAVRALAQIPSAKSAAAVLSLVDKPMDPFLDYAVWLSINDLQDTWVAAVRSGAWKSEGHEKQLEFALKAIEPAAAGAVLAEVMKTRTIPRDGSGPWIELIGQSGEEKQLKALYEQTVNGGFNDEATVRALKALVDAFHLRGAGKPADPSKLAELFKSSNGKVQREAFALAGQWKAQSLVPQIVAVINGPAEKASSKKAAIASLRQIGGEIALTELPQLIKNSEDPETKREATLALAALDMNAARQPILEVLNGLKSEDEALAFWRSLLGISGAEADLAKNLPKSGLSPLMAKAGMRVAREGGRNEPDLLLALARGADLESQGAGLTDADMNEIGKRAMASGDPARGEAIFRRTDTSCTKCHSIGGVGGKVGPDLTSIGASSQIDYLVESVFYPNRKIKDGYAAVLVQTKSSDDYSGILVSENSEQLVLRDATGKETAIPKKDIATRALGGSLMPSGLADSLTSQQQLDLFRFLAELGKPGPYDASKGNVARSWKLFPVTIDAAQFGDEKVLNSVLTDKGWSAATTLVDGRLLKESFDEALKPVASRDPKAIFAAAQLQTSGAEPVAVTVSGAETSSVWLDGKPLEIGVTANSYESVRVDSGTHTVMVKLDTGKLPNFLKLEVTGGTFLVN